MPCPNDRRRRSVTIGFRVTPDEAEWLNDVVAESGMSKQEFIMAHLRNESITVMPNVRLQIVLRKHIEQLYAELARLSSGSDVDERIACAAERLSREISQLGGSPAAFMERASDDDLFEMER